MTSVEKSVSQTNPEDRQAFVVIRAVCLTPPQCASLAAGQTQLRIGKETEIAGTQAMLLACDLGLLPDAHPASQALELSSVVDYTNNGNFTNR